ncbi:MAG: ATP-binding protein [Anaerolineales bacterium]|jgi:signal transduction histidine kinase
MRSLAQKLTLALLITGLFGVVLVAALARWTTGKEFERLTLDSARLEFLDMVSSYYAQHSSWQGVLQVLPKAQPGEDPPPFVLAGMNGNVIVGAGPFRPMQKLPPDLLARGVPVIVDAQRVGTVVTLNQPPPRTANEEDFLARLNLWVLGAALGAALLAVVISIVLARRLTRPIRQLTAAARGIAAGDLDQRVTVPTDDELGQLARSFNQMSADLARSERQRQQITADIAHDLRSPLTVIHGHLEGLRDGVLKPSAERFEAMYRETEQLMRLVEDLRTLSLADAGELPLYRNPTSPHELLARAAAAYAPQAEQKGVKIDVHADPALPMIGVDPQRMAQVLSNLMSNALRYTPPGGQIQLRAEATASQLVMKVQDTGTGIPEAELPRIFDRFYQIDTSRQSEGGESGLGLAIAKSIVEAHGGAIQAESTPGKGTIIRVTLPL